MMDTNAQVVLNFNMSFLYAKIPHCIFRRNWLACVFARLNAGIFGIIIMARHVSS